MDINVFFKSILVCLLSLSIAGLSAAASAAEADGQNLYEKRCAACHKLPDPGFAPSIGWEQQLEIMAPLARLKGDQKQDILAYLQAHSRSAAMDASLDEDQVLFEEKCSHCHNLDRILLSPLEGESLRHVINRMQSRSGANWLSDEEVERVLAYLSKVPRMVESTALAAGAGPDQIFAARCSACHTLERVYQALEDGGDVSEFWSHTVSRMQGKAPQWMSETEAGQILDYLETFESAKSAP